MIPLSYNIRNLAVRRTTTLLASFGIGIVTAIFAAMLALAEGFQSSQVGMGDPEVTVILRQGATSAISSAVTREQARIVAALPEARGGEVSPELVTLFQLESIEGQKDANILVRGVSEAAFRVHREVKIIAGRMANPALNEIIVGRSLAGKYAGLELGASFRNSGNDWTVAGIFEAAGSGYESEVWTDVERAFQAFDRNVYSMISLRLRNPEEAGIFAARVRSDPRLSLVAKNERKYYAEQAGATTTMLRGLGVFVTSILAIGAVFGAVNTMYASVGSRAGEIATLRALGFRRRDILVAFLFESAVLGLAGGLIGCLLALPLNGIQTAMMNFQSFSNTAFQFRLTPEICLYSVVWSVLMGVTGGILPALRAVRLPIVAAFRDTN